MVVIDYRKLIRLISVKIVEINKACTCSLIKLPKLRSMDYIDVLNIAAFSTLYMYYQTSLEYLIIYIEVFYI